MNYEYPLLVSGGVAGNHVRHLAHGADRRCRPDERNAARTPNEDAQSVYLDDTNLFQMSRFSGYDRNEGGIRTTYGLNYPEPSPTLLRERDVRPVRPVVGRELLRAAGHGPERPCDGARDPPLRLHRARADRPLVVRRVHGKGRFDEKSFQPRAIEASAVAYLGPLTTTATYARYDAQPERGQPFRREGVVFGGNLKFATNWSVRGNVLYDLDKYLSDPRVHARPAHAALDAVEHAARLNYKDE